MQIRRNVQVTYVGANRGLNSVVDSIFEENRSKQNDLKWLENAIQRQTETNIVDLDPARSEAMAQRFTDYGMLATAKNERPVVSDVTFAVTDDPWVQAEIVADGKSQIVGAGLLVAMPSADSIVKFVVGIGGCVRQGTEKQRLLSLIFWHLAQMAGERRSSLAIRNKLLGSRQLMSVRRALYRDIGPHTLRLVGDTNTSEKLVLAIAAPHPMVLPLHVAPRDGRTRLVMMQAVHNGEAAIFYDQFQPTPWLFLVVRIPGMEYPIVHELPDSQGRLALKALCEQAQDIGSGLSSISRSISGHLAVLERERVVSTEVALSPWASVGIGAFSFASSVAVASGFLASGFAAGVSTGTLAAAASAALPILLVTD